VFVAKNHFTMVTERSIIFSFFISARVVFLITGILIPRYFVLCLLFIDNMCNLLDILLYSFEILAFCKIHGFLQLLENIPINLYFSSLQLLFELINRAILQYLQDRGNHILAIRNQDLMTSLVAQLISPKINNLLLLDQPSDQLGQVHPRFFTSFTPLQCSLVAQLIQTVINDLKHLIFFIL